MKSREDMQVSLKGSGGAPVDPVEPRGYRLVDSELHWDKQIRDRDLKRALDAAGAPTRARRVIFGGCFKPNPATAAAADLIKTDRRQFLVLAGPGGRGKTVAAVYAMMLYRGGVFLHAPRFAMSSWFDEEKWRSWDRTGLLVLDDLGEEFDDTKGGFQMQLDTLIDARYGFERKTIITTNLTSVRFKRRYSERVRRRIREAGDFIELTGPDLSRSGVSTSSAPRAQGEKARA